MPRVFFIGGAAKSGTTWLQKMLHGHPQVSCDGEGHFFDGLAERMRPVIAEYRDQIMFASDALYGESHTYPTIEDADCFAMVRPLMERIMARQDKADRADAVGEKTPENVRYFPALNTVFPEARFINVMRDGRDCAVSGWFAEKRLHPWWLDQQFNNDFATYAEHIADLWVKDVAHGLNFTGPCITVRYEALKADPDRQMRHVLEFLEVDPDETDACIAAGAPDQMGAHYRGGGGWQDHFDTRAKEMFDEIAGEMLQTVGYA